MPHGVCAAPVWEARAAAPALPAGVAHVWRLPVEAAAAGDHRWRQLLDPAERERLSRFAFEADARREAASRGALRLLLRYAGPAEAQAELGALRCAWSYSPAHHRVLARLNS